MKIRLLSAAILLLASHFLFFACKSDKPVDKKLPSAAIIVPKFDRDSAYAFVESQVAFGPRVPNTGPHVNCKNWLVERFNAYEAAVSEQTFKPVAYTGVTLNATNVIASFNPNAARRILLAAHWDTRPFADSPLNSERTQDPPPGADDGASGVGVLLEIARQLQAQPLENIGVDIVLFDAEDYGESNGDNTNSWGLGAQHWSRNPHASPSSYKYGILLDMVGSKGARFCWEEISMTFAPQVVKKVWQTAQNLGYGNYFVNEQVGAIIDDHYFVNTIARIPMIDIINRPENSRTGFGEYWHTHEDDMDIIDARTLRAVGQTLLEVIYQEDAQLRLQ